jgi:hypothetical protein
LERHSRIGREEAGFDIKVYLSVQPRRIMANLPLSLRTIGELAGGAAELIINHAIEQAVADVDDRGEDGKARKVAIELSLVKRSDGLVEAEVAAQAKLPPRRTASTVSKPVRGQDETKLLFQGFAPDNPDQQTFGVLDRQEEDE